MSQRFKITMRGKQAYIAALPINAADGSMFAGAASFSELLAHIAFLKSDLQRLEAEGSEITDWLGAADLFPEEGELPPVSTGHRR